MAIEVTDEMRQAVYAIDCEALGHRLNTSNAFDTRVNDADKMSMDVIGPDDDTFPFISCTRCLRVWLVMPQSFATYAEAVQNFQNLLVDPELEAAQPKKVRRKKPPKQDTHRHPSDPPSTPPINAPQAIRDYRVKK